ncbi:MAG TPA: hypothetical protein VGF13_12165 [Verrucomicrobiae bacterium]
MPVCRSANQGKKCELQLNPVGRDFASRHPEFAHQVLQIFNCDMRTIAAHLQESFYCAGFELVQPLHPNALPAKVRVMAESYSGVGMTRRDVSAVRARPSAEARVMRVQ